MHNSLKFSFVSNGTEETKEHVHSTKEVFKVLEIKNSEQIDTLSERNSMLSK